MGENLPPEHDWRAVLRKHSSYDRAGYEARGLLNTNNLHLFIMDDPERELTFGTVTIPNPYDYRQRPFGPMIERLRTEQPELWEQAKASTANLATLIETRLDIEPDSAEGRELAQRREEAEWENAAVYTQVIETLAPWLIEAGIEPADLC